MLGCINQAQHIYWLHKILKKDLAIFQELRHIVDSGIIHNPQALTTIKNIKNCDSLKF